MSKKKTKRLPPRSKVKTQDTWDLSSLFENDAAWETAFKKLERKIKGYAKFQGKLGENAKTLASCLKFDLDVERAADRLAVYAYLKTTEDQTNSNYQGMLARYQNVATRASEAASYMRPEILSLSAAKLKKFLAAKEIKPFRLMLERLTRYKPHTLSESRKNGCMAMQTEMAQVAAVKTFRQTGRMPI